MEKRMEREKKERENREKKAETAVLILGWLQGEFINYLKLDAKFYICVYLYVHMHSSEVYFGDEY